MKRKIALLGIVVLALAAGGILLFRTGSSGGDSAGGTATGKQAGTSGSGNVSGMTSKWIPAEREEVERIVNPGRNSTGERLRLVHSLPGDLSEIDRRAIAEYLKHGPNSDIEYVIKNDLMNKLRNQNTLPPELGELLIGLCTDRTQDVTVRAYALQHLRPQYEKTADPAIRDVYFALLDETENGMAGGALLALRHLAQEFPKEFDAGEIARRAAEIAADADTANLTRISALQVASRLGAKELEPVALELAKEETAPLPLRLSAIAALGELNAAGNLPLLQTLSGTKGPVGKAALAAMKKIP